VVPGSGWEAEDGLFKGRQGGDDPNILPTVIAAASTRGVILRDVVLALKHDEASSHLMLVRKGGQENHEEEAHRSHRDEGIRGRLIEGECGQPLDAAISRLQPLRSRISTGPRSEGVRKVSGDSGRGPAGKPLPAMAGHGGQGILAVR